jgi:hypothetical protein
MDSEIEQAYKAFGLLPEDRQKIIALLLDFVPKRKNRVQITAQYGLSPEELKAWALAKPLGSSWTGRSKPIKAWLRGCRTIMESP